MGCLYEDLCFFVCMMVIQVTGAHGRFRGYLFLLLSFKLFVTVHWIKGQAFTSLHAVFLV